ncbi:MAG: hypothetical protein AAGJ52_03840 [Pseudomonadota bacterium]
MKFILSLFKPLALISTFCLPLMAQSGTVEWEGFIGARAGVADGPTGWPEGGFGRLYAGGDSSEDFDPFGRLEGQVAMNWQSDGSWSGRIHAIARAEDSDVPGPGLGVTEAWLGYQRAGASSSEFRARAGLFFYPSSQENIDPLWGSPYTLTYSALNSWIAEEFRPIGLDLEQRFFGESGFEWQLGATIFGGNDQLGTLVAWRGWSMHDRLSLLEEDLSLPPNFPLEPDGSFGRFQRPFETTSFGDDLDSRPGYALRAGFDNDGRIAAQLSFVDNRGDRELHGDEYAWRTEFWLLGGFWAINEQWELIFEGTRGKTKMNFPGSPWVDVDFHAAYLMASVVTDQGRWSLRHDRFGAADRIGRASWGIYDDGGQAWTLAWVQTLAERHRVGAELLWLDSTRPVSLQSGGALDTGGSTVTVEWRWLF